MKPSVSLTAVTFVVAPIVTASATVPFARPQLAGELVDKLIEIAQHGVKDAPYVEAKLSITPNSQWVRYFVGDAAKDVTVSIFNMAAAKSGLMRGIEADGDILPMRSGRFWNLQFSYVLESPKQPHMYPYHIEIFEVEEYSCITRETLKNSFLGSTEKEGHYSFNHPITDYLHYDPD